MKELRQRANLTQVELARAVNVSARTIAVWENGEGQPHLEHVKCLLDVLNCSFEELYQAFEETKRRSLAQ